MSHTGAAFGVQVASPREARRVRTASRIDPEQLVTVREAAKKGVSKGVLRGTAFRPVLRGVHARFDHPDPTGLMTMAKALVKVTCLKGLVASVSALELLGVQIPRIPRRDQRIHVLLSTKGPFVRRPEVKVHWSRTIDKVRRTTAPGGIPVCDPIEAWMQAAKIAGHEQLVQLGDQLVRYDNALTTLKEMTQRVAQCRGRRHIRKLRAALADVREGTQSVMETWMRLQAKDAGMPEPQVNVDIYDADGNWLARPDLWWEELQVAGEYDGAHHADPAQRAKDNDRRRRMEDAGIVIVTATQGDLSDPTRLIAAFQRVRGRAAQVRGKARAFAGPRRTPARAASPNAGPIAWPDRPRQTTRRDATPSPRHPARTAGGATISTLPGGASGSGRATPVTSANAPSPDTRTATTTPTNPPTKTSGPSDGSARPPPPR